MQIIKNTKRNRYKRTNEQWYSRPLWPFLKGTETKYEMKTKLVLISKEQKQIYKKEHVETRRLDRHSPSQINSEPKKSIMER